MTKIEQNFDHVSLVLLAFSRNGPSGICPKNPFQQKQGKEIEVDLKLNV